MTQDELLIKLFNEVAYVWPRVGYPPLVTPFSQYVKNGSTYQTDIGIYGFIGTDPGDFTILKSCQ